MHHLADGVRPAWVGDTIERHKPDEPLSFDGLTPSLMEDVSLQTGQCFLVGFQRLGVRFWAFARCQPTVKCRFLFRNVGVHYLDMMDALLPRFRHYPVTFQSRRHADSRQCVCGCNDSDE